MNNSEAFELFIIFSANPSELANICNSRESLGNNHIIIYNLGYITFHVMFMRLIFKHFYPGILYFMYEKHTTNITCIYIFCFIHLYL